MIRGKLALRCMPCSCNFFFSEASLQITTTQLLIHITLHIFNTFKRMSESNITNCIMRCRKNE